MSWPRARLTVAAVYLTGAGIAAAAFVAAGFLLAVTLPYHQWDSFGFGDWSRAIAQHGKIDPFFAGPQSAARPVFYELQGFIWSLTAHSGIGFPGVMRCSNSARHSSRFSAAKSQ